MQKRREKMETQGQEKIKEERREERREEEREEARQEKRQDEERRKDEFFFFKKCFSGTLKTRQMEIRPRMFPKKKSLFGRNYSSVFSFESAESGPVF